MATIKKPAKKMQTGGKVKIKIKIKPCFSLYSITPS